MWISILAAAILGQTAFFVRDYVLPWGWRAKQVWDEPRLFRSADMSIGAQGARAIEFVNENVPSDGTIVLPPPGDAGRFALERSMQYFYFPRQVVECRGGDLPACIEAAGSKDVYALATPSEAASVPAGMSFLPAPEGSGWLAGILGPSFRGPGLPEYTAGSLALALSGDLFLLLLFAAVGVAVLWGIGVQLSGLEAIALSTPLGGGLLTWCLFLLSWLGFRLTPLTWVLIGSALVLLGVVLGRRRGRQLAALAGFRRSSIRIPELPTLLLLVAGLALFAMAVGMSIGTSYRLFDPVQIWSVKGYGIGHARSISAGAQWGVHGLTYPINLPMQISAFYQFNGDLIPGSKLLYPIYGLGLCLLVYAFLRRQGVDRVLAGLGALLVGSLPIVFFHATSGFANLPYSFYLVAGALWLLDGASDRDWGDQLLGSTLLGLAAWTRPEGLPFCLALLAVIYLFSRFQAGWGLRTGALLPLLAIAGAWFAFTLGGGHFSGSIIHDAVDVYSGGGSGNWLQLNGLLTLFRVFGYSMFVPYLAQFPSISATNWGVLFPIVLLLLIWRSRDLHPRRQPKSTLLALVTLAIGAATVALYYLPSYSMGNYVAFIERAFPRAFLPTAILMTVLAIWLLASRLGVDAVPEHKAAS